MDGLPTQARGWFAGLFDHCDDPILLIKGDRFVGCNPAAARALKVDSPEDVLALRPWEISPPRQAGGKPSDEAGLEHLERARLAGNHRFEWIHTDQDGDSFAVEVLLTSIESEDEPIYYVVWRDLDRVQALEGALDRARRLETTGLLAGGVAHDFNNFLTAIIAGLDLLEAENLSSEARALVHELHGHCNRAAELSRSVLAFANPTGSASGPTRVDEVVRELSPLLRRLVGAQIVIELQLPAHPVLSHGARSPLEQVVVNFVENARHALSGPGTIRITVEQTHVPDPPTPDAAPGDYAVVSVSDAGVGMDSKTLARVFEPFFTTKGKEGTGLGLANSFELARRARGFLRLESAAGVGTTAALYLPAAAP